MSRGSAEASEPAQRPNVLVILADDLGWGDLSCYGSPLIRTPHLDQLAADGIRFTNGYSAAAVCSPTRFALYTGRYPGRLPGGLQEPIGGPNEQHGIPPEHPALGSLLKQAGYTTAMFGKWHCGYLPWFSPTKSGWDTFFGNFGGALDYYSKMSGNGRDLYEGEVPVESLDYYTDTIADRAAEFVRARHDRPWLLNLNFTAPHWPWEAPGDLEVSKELTARLAAGDRQALVHNDGGTLETYRKMVEAMDAGIGRVLSALRDSGKERDTFVLFSSDNGGERWSYEWPLSGNKGSLFEGGIRVPTIVRWPAHVLPDQESDVPVITQDWTATILRIAGTQPVPTHPLDGRDLVSYLVDTVVPGESDLFWRTRSARALRRGRWKFLRQGTNPDALYDLITDPRERANLAQRYPRIVSDLSASWEEINQELLPYP
ncbi:sulfatase-like hydrolase/transferase [Kibdelosporangium persicum]|uniref:sulfatase-like hydrolase/transferase n=1 Tax=Kibdelosporangium persicum TaxID=2698649 RepID=UPI0028ABBE1B|nr:sulfatase-like hydrolase/transferase [Kibdelosporangium persicum]